MSRPGSQSTKPKGQLSRRQLLTRLGAVGGSAAVYTAASALGLFNTTGLKAAHPAFALQRKSEGDNAPSVVILGAGVGGLVAAYELDRAGYDVTVLEASARIGGRNLTARAGTVIDELGNPQRCSFDDDKSLYFNCGPARIPGTHTRLLGYCRDFGIPLANFVNENPNAYIQADSFNGGSPLRQREYLADAKGFMSEFAAKAVNETQLDKPVNSDDEERLLAFLRRFGDLSDTMHYKGTERAGYQSGGLLKPGVKKPTAENLSDLLSSPYWQFQMYFAEGETQFPAMLTPEGGMDQVVKAFTARIGHKVTTKARVTAFRLTDTGVTVDYDHNGSTKRVTADYCMNSMPGHLVNGIDHNLPSDISDILGMMRGSKLSKVGLQMKQRFWEDDGIYGGISWTDHPLMQIWYPSHGTFSQKGVLLGGYCFGPQNNDTIACMSHEDRIEAALSMGEKIHGATYRTNYESGISIAWQNYNHMLGCGSGFDRSLNGYDTMSPDQETAMRLKLQKPIGGRYFMIGDQVSFHPGWQEGAIAITHQALKALESSSLAISV